MISEGLGIGQRAFQRGDALVGEQLGRGSTGREGTEKNYLSSVGIVVRKSG